MGERPVYRRRAVVICLVKPEIRSKNRRRIFRPRQLNLEIGSARRQIRKSAAIPRAIRPVRKIFQPSGFRGALRGVGEDGLRRALRRGSGQMGIRAPAQTEQRGGGDKHSGFHGGRCFHGNRYNMRAAADNTFSEKAQIRAAGKTDVCKFRRARKSPRQESPLSRKLSPRGFRKSAFGAAPRHAHLILDFKFHPGNISRFIRTVGGKSATLEPVPRARVKYEQRSKMETE